MAKFGESFGYLPPERSTPSEDVGRKPSVFKRLKESRLAKAGLVAAALHTPAIPGVGRFVGVERIPASIQELNRRWNTPGMVLHPQSESERADVERRVARREERRDEKGLAAFHASAAERLDHGVPVTYRELYFEQERLNGVDQDEVAKAEKIADGLVSYYASQLEHGLDDELIRRMSRELYERATYDWGQGSVTKYFVDRKRNCVSYADAERIVLEGVIARLPETERERYSLGTRFESQHEIATLAASAHADGASGRLYALEPPYDVESIGRPPAGTADVGEPLLKQALAGKTVKISAAEPQGGQVVQGGPRIDFNTDQPLEDGIIVEGRLRGAEENKTQAERQRILPVPETEVDVQVKTGEEPTPEAIALRFDEADAAFVKTGVPAEVNAADLVSPRPEVIASMRHQPHARRIMFGDISKWSKESISELVKLDVDEISAELDSSGRLPDHILAALQSRAVERIKTGSTEKGWSILGIRQPSTAQEEVHLPPEQMRVILLMMRANLVKGKSGYEALRLDYSKLTDEEFKLLRELPPSAIYLTKRFKDVFDLTDASSSLPEIEQAVQEQDLYEKQFARLGIPVYVQIPDVSLLGQLDPLFDESHRAYPDLLDMNENDHNILVARIVSEWGVNSVPQTGTKSSFIVSQVNSLSAYQDATAFQPGYEKARNAWRAGAAAYPRKPSVPAVGGA